MTAPQPARPGPPGASGPGGPDSGEEAGVLVVGAGLLGTSVGMALRESGVPVWLEDNDPAAARLAADLGAGIAGSPERDPGVVLVAVPPTSTALVVVTQLRRWVSSTVSDLASVKAQPLVEIEALLADSDQRGLLPRFVGGHPLAGRERSGAAAARADLFRGVPWVLTPTATTSPSSVELVQRLAERVGAVARVMSPPAHDEAVATVSHLPQVVSTLLAAALTDAPSDALGLAGSGVRDSTRIAASDPDLWLQILQANAGPVCDLLDGFAADLDRFRSALRALTPATGEDVSTSRRDDESLDRARTEVRSLLERGNRGRARIPGKHGGRAVVYDVVPVVVPDEPSALARLFGAAGEAGVNIEDVSIEHSPGQRVGLVELSVAPGRAGELSRALETRGWRVH